MEKLMEKVKVQVSNLPAPKIPYVLRFYTDEIIDRIQSESIHCKPSSFRSLLSNASSYLEVESKDRIISINNCIVVETLERAFTESTACKDINIFDLKFRRINFFASVNNRELFAGLLMYIEAVIGNKKIPVNYPDNGWIVVGAPILDPDYDIKKCESMFRDEADVFIVGLTSVNRHKDKDDDMIRDMFVLVMKCLASIYSQAADQYRTHVIITKQIRQVIATTFGPLFLKVICTVCKIEELGKCKVCSRVTDLIASKRNSACIEHLLEFLSVMFWQDHLLTPRQDCMNMGQENYKLIEYYILLQIYNPDSAEKGIPKKNKENEKEKSKEKTLKSEKPKKKKDKEKGKRRSITDQVNESDPPVVENTVV